MTLMPTASNGTGPVSRRVVTHNHHRSTFELLLTDVEKHFQALTRTARLSPEQKAQIPELLVKGAPAYGFRGDVWTASRVAKVIEKTFAVRYSRDHVGRLIREAGWSRQKPIERATQRNEASIKLWQQERWP